MLTIKMNKMKKIYLIFIISLISVSSFSQSQNITSSAIVFKQYNSEKDKTIKDVKIADAKRLIDKAFNNQSTSNDPKMWMYRAQIYKTIAYNHSELDANAIFKATESHLKCMEPHPKKKNKIIIYKKWEKEKVFTGLMQCANKLFNLAVEAYQNNDFQSSLDLYKPIYDIIAIDTDGQLKKMKITNESLTHNSYLSSLAMNDNVMSKSFLQKLIDMDSQKPNIYSSMSKIYLKEGDINNALKILSEGRNRFSDNQALVNEEVNLYIELGKTEELVNKLSENIIKYPENDTYLVIRGTCYQNSNDIERSIVDYKSALSINPDNLTALNNISSCYLKQTESIIKDLNKLSYKQTTKHKKYKSELKGIHLSALPYLEHYISLEPTNKQLLTVLAEIYYKLDMYDKSKQTKSKLAELK